MSEDNTTPQSMGYITITTRLPAKYLKQIGRIVIAFACIEHFLRVILYELLKLTEPQGRLAVRAARIEDFLTLIQDLESLAKTNAASPLREIAQELKDLEYMRDWFSHGIWSKTNGTYHIVSTSGKWQPPGHPKGVKRKIFPSAHQVSFESIKGIADEAQGLVRVVDDVYQRVCKQQRSSPQKQISPRPETNAKSPHRPK